MFVNELKSGGIRALLDYDNTIFDNFTIPEEIGGEEVIKMIIDRILFKYGDTPLFCPDPAVIKYYIGLWSNRHSPLWLKYYNIEFAEYNPIENYDKYDEGTNTIENQISADNATTYQPDTKTIATPALHTHGNIGVRSAQELAEQEINLIPKLDCIDFIADDFKTEFCLYVY